MGFLVACKESYDLVQGFLNDSLPNTVVRRHYKYDSKVRALVKQKTLDSMAILDSAIDRHHLEEIAISYNGGKDCLVMLILLLATIHKRSVKNGIHLPPDYKLDSIYINSEDPFPKLAEFIDSSTKNYHLNPIMIKSGLKQGFETYLNKINPKIKSIIVGIRRSDPYGSNLQYEQVTDHNWPKFLRIHPILEWHYIEIWDFLVGCNVEYCSMYDLGYTSLGGISNTLRNPCLRIGDSDDYYPAYTLLENADERERLGRNTK